MSLRRPHKYGAVATDVDGIRFASKREARRYGELKLLAKAGEIWDLELQPGFELQVENAGYPDNGQGRSVTVGVYRADFAYHDRSGRVVEDSKGCRTAVYRLKKRMVETQYGIKIMET